MAALLAGGGGSPSRPAIRIEGDGPTQVGGAPDWPTWLAAQRVPGAKSAKNRLRLDLLAGGGSAMPLDKQRARAAAAVDRPTALGATFVTEMTEQGTH
jgi:hypothetical protein